MQAPATMLIALGGLPGTGKSTLATAFAGRLRAIHLRIDTIEQAMRHAGQDVSAAEGYLVARDVALDNLGLGLSVVVDAVNPIEFTRNLWRHAASRCGARLLEIELVCSDDVEHRRRVESRTADIPGFVLPTWSHVQDREYEPWTTAEVIDTAGRTVDETIAQMVACL